MKFLPKIGLMTFACLGTQMWVHSMENAQQLTKTAQNASYPSPKEQSKDEQLKSLSSEVIQDDDEVGYVVALGHHAQKVREYKDRWATMTQEQQKAICSHYDREQADYKRSMTAAGLNDHYPSYTPPQNLGYRVLIRMTEASIVEALREAELDARWEAMTDKERNKICTYRLASTAQEREQMSEDEDGDIEEPCQIEDDDIENTKNHALYGLTDTEIAQILQTTNKKK